VTALTGFLAAGQISLLIRRVTARARRNRHGHPEFGEIGR
jgi:hypothetical protein